MPPARLCPIACDVIIVGNKYSNSPPTFQEFHTFGARLTFLKCWWYMYLYGGWLIMLEKRPYQLFKRYHLVPVGAFHLMSELRPRPRSSYEIMAPVLRVPSCGSSSHEVKMPRSQDTPRNGRKKTQPTLYSKLTLSIIPRYGCCLEAVW